MISPRVTDIHLHIQPWDQLLPGPRQTMIERREDAPLLTLLMRSPDRLIAFLDEEGVERAALINYVSPDLMGFTFETNRFVADYCRAHPDRLIPFGSVHPRLSRDPAAELRLLLGDLGIRGIKIHPLHQLVAANGYVDGSAPALETIYREAERAGVPVMIHTGTSIFPGARNRFGDPMAADDVAVDFPDLPLILAHAGRPLWAETAFFLARRHKNVHLDLSGIPPARLLTYLPRLEEIAAKALFGTDWPGPGVKSIKENVTRFLDLPLSEKTKTLILWENAARLFP